MNLKLIQKITVALAILLVPVFYNSCGEPYHSPMNEDLSSTGGLTASAESLTVFSATLHPVLKQSCGGCHGAGQAPEFAVTNASLAHSTTINSNLVSFSNPASSRLVQKVLQGHNGISSSIATSMQNQISAWNSQLTAGGEAPPTAAPLTATFKSLYDQVLVPKCIGCHGSTVAKDGVRYDTYSQTMKTVKLSNPSESKLYTSIKSGSMPRAPYPDVTNEELNKLLEWLILGAQNN